MRSFISTYTPGHKLWNKYLKAAVNLIYGCYVTNPVNLGEIAKSATPETNIFMRPVMTCGYFRYLRLCVCINHLFVHAITRNQFKPGSPI